MNRENKLRTLAAVALVSLVGVTSTLLIPRDGDTNSKVMSELGVSSSNVEVRLYQPSVTPSLTGDGLPEDLVRSTRVTKNGQTTSFDQFRNGTTADIHLFSDGAKTASSEDYFATLADGSRQLRSEATFDTSGPPDTEQLFKSHKVYRQNSGTLERFGQRLRDGRYEQTYMFEDGVTPQRDRYFDSSLAFFTETVYRWNADKTSTYVYAKLVRGDFQGQMWVTLYREDGSRYATIKDAPGIEEGSLFSPDGKMIAEWGQEVGHFYFLAHDGGSELPTSEWESLMGRTKVIVMDPVTHRIVLQQIWKERPDPSVPGGKHYLLMTAAKFYGDNQPIVRVDMSDNGSRPRELTILGKDGGTVERLDKSGRKVVNIQKQSASGQTVSSQPPAQDTPEEYAEIDPALLRMPKRPDVPTYKDDGPPRIYDYK